MKLRILALLVCLLCFVSSARAQLWSGVLSSARATDWTVVGVPGGIPSSGWSKCGSTINPYGTFGSPGLPDTINNAIAACGANTYVLLGPGFFYLTKGILHQKSGVELRGSGPDQTFLILFGFESCSGINAGVCLMGYSGIYYGTNPNAQIGGTNSCSFTGTNATTGTYTAGATSIRLASCGSAGVTNGDYIYLDQTDDSAVAAGFLVGTDKTLTPPFSLEQVAPGRCYPSWPSPNPCDSTQTKTPRTQVQIVKVTAGCSSPCNSTGPYDVTIPSPGLIGLNWRTSQNPGAWFPGPITGPNTGVLKNAGVQGLTIDYVNSGTGTSQGGVVFFNAAEDWAYNIRSIKAHRNHFWFWQAAKNTVLDVYAYDSYNASSQSYGVEAFISSQNLVANSIFQHVTGPIVVGNSIGSAYVANFGIDCAVAQGTLTVTQTSMSGCPGACVGTYTYSGYSSINGSFVSTLPISIRGLTNGSGEFNGDNLVTSNVTGTTFQVAFPSGTNVGAAAESATGFVSNGTLYPAWTLHDSGVNYNIFEMNIGALVYADVFHGTGNANTFFRNWLVGNEKGKFGAILAFDMRSYQRYNNIIGNVLGSSVKQTAYENYTGCGGCSGVYSYSLGFGNTNGTITVSPDTDVRNTMMRWGNVDAFHTTTPQWNSSEVPSGLVDGYANSVPGSHTLPASFVFSSKPAWYASAYATAQWPPIGPDVTGGTGIAPDLLGTTTSGFAYANPAELCYLNAPLDNTNYPNGYDRGVLNFNAATCYTGAAGPTPPQPAGVVITAYPLPSQPQLSSVSPNSTYVTNSGCSQNGTTFVNPCIFKINCSGCGSTTNVFFDGTQVTQTYSAGVLTATVPLSLLPIPTAATQHSFTATNPVATLTRTKKRSRL